jgi:hypothetical protein
MTDVIPTAPAASEEPMLDALLREAVPEVKLALGDLIDRDNARSLPDRYARLLPETTLGVTLRPDAADALTPVAAELERELTDSCMRHGSLYDRAYRVKLRRADNPGAPLFRVSVVPPEAAKAEPDAADATALAAPPATAGAASPSAPAVVTGHGPAPAPPAAAPRETPMDGGTMASPAPRLAGLDPDATRLDGFSAPAALEPGRYVLRMEDGDGEVVERFPLEGVLTTVGRRSEDPALRSDVMLPDVPHVSRRQLALVWDGKAFTVFNLGLNALRVGEREVAGANVGRGPLRLEAVSAAHAAPLGPGERVRIGEAGPWLRVEDTGERGPAIDPDATRLG